MPAIQDENIDEAIKGIKAAGLKVALLTNNGYRAADKKKSVIMECLEHFDVIVESCRVGLRKPDPEIYKVTLCSNEKEVGRAISARRPKVGNMRDFPRYTHRP